MPNHHTWVAALVAMLVTTASAGLRPPVAQAAPGGPAAGTVAGAVADAPRPPLPALTNLSGLTDLRAAELGAEALLGLGFAPGAPDGPRADDRLIVTDAAVAWIDETGFYGKLNGLWWLAPTTSGDRSFTMRDTDGRPINQLVVGERGDGAWPPGYRGAEHIEMPNGTAQPDDDPACTTTGSWCSQFSLDEAGTYTYPGIPWWKLCDPGALGALDHVDPIEVTPTADGLRLVYEARLVKRAGGHFPWTTTTGCHEDWLFPDGIRRPVYLRVGYELSRSEPRIDRILQVRNPAGNPPFSGPFSFIGGFVVTTWPDPMPAKALNAFIRPEIADVPDPYRQRTLTADGWNDGWPAPVGVDIAFGWMGHPFTLSRDAGATNGRSLRLSLEGPADNLDVGFCLCQSHGGIELGGGLLHSAPASDAALPIDGGETSIEGRRRLSTPASSVIADVPPWTGPTTTTSTTAPRAPVVTPAFTG